MKNFNEYIQEKYLIDINIDNNEDIMHVSRNKLKLFDYKLFINTLEKMSKDYECCKDIMIFTEKDSKEQVYSLYDIDSLAYNDDCQFNRIYIDNNKCIMITLFKCKKVKNMQKYFTNGVLKLIEKSKLSYYDIKRFEYFDFYLALPYIERSYNPEYNLKEIDNMYIWPSIKDNCLKILLSNKNYKDLQKENKFI